MVMRVLPQPSACSAAILPCCSHELHFFLRHASSDTCVSSRYSTCSNRKSFASMTPAEKSDWVRLALRMLFRLHPLSSLLRMVLMMSSVFFFFVVQAHNCEVAFPCRGVLCAGS